MYRVFHGHEELTPEDYITASLIIYVDLVFLFLSLLSGYSSSQQCCCEYSVTLLEQLFQLLDYSKLSICGYHFHSRSSSPLMLGFCDVDNGHIWLQVQLGGLQTCRLQPLQCYCQLSAIVWAIYTATGDRQPDFLHLLHNTVIFEYSSTRYGTRLSIRVANYSIVAALLISLLVLLCSDVRYCNSSTVNTN